MIGKKETAFVLQAYLLYYTLRSGQNKNHFFAYA